MKQYLDERQEQIVGKFAHLSFLTMYMVCAIAIIAQLVWWNQSLEAVAGETIAMLAGGIVYLIGVVQIGGMTSEGICISKKVERIGNIISSMVIAGVFSIFYGMILNKRKGSVDIPVGRYTVLFFLFIMVLCLIVLTVLGVISKHIIGKETSEYEDEEGR